MTPDGELLRRYTETHSENAFAELVERHLNLVYSAALRQVNGDAHLAQDVAQTVFADLARKAASLAGRPGLTGWLYTSAHFAAAKAVRAERRRHSREEEAQLMNQLLSDAAPDLNWEKLRPVLDAAMLELNETDREAVLLRYFDNRPHAEIAERFGLSENAARMRVDRALEKLRTLLGRRGVSTTTALAAVISTNAVQVAPAGLAAMLSTAALANVAAAGGTLIFLKFMTTTKLKLVVASAVILGGVLITILLKREAENSKEQNDLTAPSASSTALGSAENTSRSVGSDGFPRRERDAAPATLPEEIVANKLSQWARSRRDIAHAIARRQNIQIPDAVKLFFDAVESGNWEQIHARFMAICGDQPNASSGGTGRPPGIEPIWPAIFAAYIAAEQVHSWPAQKLLDFGNDVLGSLRPGMVYLGGTDEGRAIPEFLNETRDGERHIVMTQNGLADSNYLKYLDFLYREQLATLTDEDAKRAFDDYVADARKRLLHDQQFPDEPKQIRPGENFADIDGNLRVSGPVAVMAVNDRLVQTLMQKNPGISFALEESTRLTSSYADASPLGPLLELRASDRQNALTADASTQSVGYWRDVAQQLLSDPDAPDGSDVRKTYGHMAEAQANLFAEHNLSEQAEQAYRVANTLWPDRIETIIGLSELLVREGRRDEANQILDDFSRNYPKQTVAVETVRMRINSTAPPTKP